MWILLLLSSNKAFASDWGVEIASSLKNEAQKQLSARYSKDVRVEVEELGIRAQSSCVQLDTVEIVLRADEDFRGPVPVIAYLKYEGVVCQKWSFRSRLSVLMEMFVAQSAVAPKEEIPIGKALVRYDLMQGTPLASKKGPWIARTKLRKMEPLTHEKVKLKPLNLDGDQVDIVFKNKSLEIRMKGKLLTEGYPNSRVRVLSMTTSTVLEGILIQKDLVEVIGAQQ